MLYIKLFILYKVPIQDKEFEYSIYTGSSIYVLGLLYRKFIYRKRGASVSERLKE